MWVDITIKNINLSVQYSVFHRPDGCDIVLECVQLDSLGINILDALQDQNKDEIINKIEDVCRG